MRCQRISVSLYLGLIGHVIGPQRNPTYEVLKEDLCAKTSRICKVLLRNMIEAGCDQK